jgi:Secretion system C-terminal sorting domain
MKVVLILVVFVLSLQLSAQEEVSSELTKEWKVSCYPNPTSDLLIIESSDEIKSVTLINLNGEVIKPLSMPNWCYSLSEIPAGWVFVYIENQAGEIMKKNVFKTE